MMSRAKWFTLYLLLAITLGGITGSPAITKAQDPQPDTWTWMEWKGQVKGHFKTINGQPQGRQYGWICPRQLGEGVWADNYVLFNVPSGVINRTAYERDAWGSWWEYNKDHNYTSALPRLWPAGYNYYLYIDESRICGVPAEYPPEYYKIRGQRWIE